MMKRKSSNIKDIKTVSSFKESKTATKIKDCSVVTESGQARWGALMKKFTENNKEICTAVQCDRTLEKKQMKMMSTGSKYEGTWDIFGMTGFGLYGLPNGVVYDGDIKDGEFHGEGEFRYDNDLFIRGHFERGVMTTRKMVFGDGLEYTEEGWKYCQFPDRRYTIEYEAGMEPATQSYLTADEPSREIPPGFYDVGYGLYDPKTRVVFKYNDLTAIIRAPSPQERKWIVTHCRTSPDVPLGPTPHLYEEWPDPEVDPPAPPPPAAITTTYDAEFVIEDDEDYNIEDYEDSAWRHSRRSTVGSKIKTRMFYKFGDKAGGVCFN